MAEREREALHLRACAPLDVQELLEQGLEALAAAAAAAAALDDASLTCVGEAEGGEEGEGREEGARRGPLSAIPAARGLSGRRGALTSAGRRGGRRGREGGGGEGGGGGANEAVTSPTAWGERAAAGSPAGAPRAWVDAEHLAGRERGGRRSAISGRVSASSPRALARAAVGCGGGRAGGGRRNDGAHRDRA